MFVFKTLIYILFCAAMAVSTGYSQDGNVLNGQANQPPGETESADGRGNSGPLMRDPADINTEIVVLIDTSTSMGSFDPEGRVKTILSEFFDGQDPATNVSVMSFGEDVEVLSPLSPARDSGLTDILSGIDYRAATDDIRRGLERAVYELKYNGVVSTEKFIILLTDGLNPVHTSVSSPEIIDDTVISDMNETGIRVITVSLGQTGGDQFLQSLSARSGSERVNVAGIDNLAQTLRDIGMNLRPEEPEPATAVPAADMIPEISPSVNEVRTQAGPETRAATTTNVGSEDRTRSIIIITALIILVAALGALIVLLYLRGRSLKRDGVTAVNEAYLVDIHGYTSNKRYRLGEKATMLGRVSGKDSKDIDYIVIPEATIGRRHAVIEYKDYAFWIMDQGSINGTFVNNLPITSEIRLKHGDIVRLHKYEFQFSIPELDEAGMTKVSDTVMAGYTSESESPRHEELDAVRKNLSGGDFALDLDFTESEPSPSSQGEEVVESRDDETLLPGHDMEADNNEKDTADETLMPDVTAPAAGGSVPAPDSRQVEEDEQRGDETLMPGKYGDDDKDVTIRPNTENPGDDLIDITGPENDK